MGTNFYVDADSTCNNPAHTKTLHIGKSSAGWQFSFRAYDDLGLISWEAWRTYLAARGAFGLRRARRITDEYGTEVTLAEFERVVTDRHTPEGEDRPFSHANPSPGCRVRGFGGRWTPPELDAEGRPDRYEDPAGFDFSRREFS